jgi:hypothetical protein
MTYALSYLNDRLKIAAVTWDVKRTDELSGTGDGRIWQSELAPPLWTAQVDLQVGWTHELKQIAALIRSLRGAQEPFLLCDPTSKFPNADPSGLKLGGADPYVATAGVDRSLITLAGLPANYRLTIGDKFELSYGASPVRYGFYEISQDVTSSGSGVTPQFKIFPELPNSVPINTYVKLIRPACRCIIIPGSHNPGSASPGKTEGATFKVIQKK